MEYPRHLFFAAWMLVLNCTQAAEVLRDGFGSSSLTGWKTKDGQWKIADGSVEAGVGFAALLREQEGLKDGVIEADVTYEHDAPFAASGLLFRMSEDFTGYAVCLREVEKGTDPVNDPWERPVLQLFRIDKDGWKLLQESKVMGCRSGLSRHLKVACHGPDFFVFYEDMKTPVIREFDDHYIRAGKCGIFKDPAGIGRFDNFIIGALEALPEAPLRTDWSWVRGAVYVRSSAVNAVQMWHDYWPHTALLDRELELASLYGFNVIQAYLQWIVWNHDSADYLKKIDDFLARAAKHGLKVNLIFWDDCGSVMPSLTFAAPVPGRHNSQMMPNPAHSIRDSATEMLTHRERFGSYVRGIAARFKDDPRLSFWQLYNEGMGAKERIRVSDTDANINRLLGWTREWVKGTGTRIPVTATGGGFFGPQFSDFPSYHSYSPSGQPLPNADGGPEHLCTETLNRPHAGIAVCLRDLAGKRNGFVVWELMIGNDNCRYPWGHPDGFAEPNEPFHGVIYPDGHPWDAGEIKALMGDEAFASLQKRVFKVEYFQGRFGELKKESITPWIDFHLNDEPGHGSPDASAGIGKDDFSVRWSGKFQAAESGIHVFHADSDGIVRVKINESMVLEKAADEQQEKSGQMEFQRGKIYSVLIEYSHGRGPSRLHLTWSGPEFEKRLFRLNAK